MLVHETKMDIPIFNSIYYPEKNLFYSTNKLNLDKINKLNLSIPNKKKFKALDILKLIPSKDSLFETILISINDELVKMFLNKEISYEKLLIYLIKIIKFKNFKKYCNVKPKSINDIIRLNNFVKNFTREYVKKNN